MPSWYRDHEDAQLSSGLTLLILLTLVTQFPPRKLSDTIALIICVGCYKFSQRYVIQSGSTFFFLCGTPFPSCETLWEPDLTGNTAEIPLPACWRPPSIWKLQKKPRSHPLHYFRRTGHSSEPHRSKERKKERGCTSQRCVTCTMTEAQKNHGFSQLSLLFTPGDSDRGIISMRHLCLLDSRHRHSHFHSLSQIKGHSAFFPLSILRRNIALPLLFAVFSQHGLRGPCNINPVLPPHTG